MRRVAVTLVVAALCWSHPAGAETMRLRDAIRLALARNERAVQAGQRVEAAEGSLDRARAGYLPSVVVTAGASKALEPDRKGNSVPISSFAALTISQPILNFPALPQIGQARQALEAERAGAIDTRRVLAFDAARAFLQALTSEQVRRSAEQRLTRARANLANAEARAEAGLASVNDATRARLDVASAQRDVASSVGNERRALLSLEFIIGEPVSGGLEAPDAMTRSAEVFHDGGQSLASTAVARRPDLTALRAKVDAAVESAREPKYRYAPTLSVSGQVRLTPDASAFRYHEETLSLSLSWTLYDGGVRAADRRSRDAQVELARMDLRYAARSVDRDVRANMAVLEGARLSFRSAEEAVAAAQKNVEEAGILYRQGLGRAIELVDASSKLFDAEVSLATAKLQMEQAYLEVRYALGLEPLEEGTTPR